MKRLAIGRHTSLYRRRRLYAIGRRGRMTDNRNASIRIRPQPVASSTDRWIPSQELCGGDAVFTSYGGTALVFGH
jgi:hypothetical protein